MGGLWPWFLTVCGLIVAVAGTELTDDKDDELSLTEELASDGVWKFTCDEYCAFCGCVGQFLRDEDKCVCSCEPSTAGRFPNIKFVITMLNTVYLPQISTVWKT